MGLLTGHFRFAHAFLSLLALCFAKMISESKIGDFLLLGGEGPLSDDKLPLRTRCFSWAREYTCDVEDIKDGLRMVPLGARSGMALVGVVVLAPSRASTCAAPCPVNCQEYVRLGARSVRPVLQYRVVSSLFHL